MTITTKRMDEVEMNLTPKEFAIVLVNTMRQFPSLDAFATDQIHFPSGDDSVMIKPYNLLVQQVEKRYGRMTDDQRRAANKEIRKLQAEFHTLKLLVNRINQALVAKAQTAGLEAALRAQILQATMMQDSFSRTARKASEWIEEYKAKDKTEDKNRREMLAELAAYFFDTEEQPAVDLGMIRIDFPSKWESSVEEIKALVFDLYKHREAVRIIEAKYYDNHRILAIDVEADLDRVIRIVEEVVATHNDYLQTREEIFRDEWNEDEVDGLVGCLSGERQGRLKIDLKKPQVTKKAAERTAENWVKFTQADVKAQLSNDASADWKDMQRIMGVE